MRLAGPARRLAVVALGLAVAACGTGARPAARPQRRPTPTPAFSPAPSPSPGTTLKPVLAGLLSRDGPPAAAYLPATGGFVVNVNWSDLQTAPGAPIASGNAIDQAIGQVHQLDPTGKLGIKVRLFAGIHAPAWAKSLGGAPVSVTDPVTGSTGTIGRFWTPAYGAAYATLQQELAARYDAAPEIREVTISRCTTVFSEPFIRDTNSPATVAALDAAGFTVALDKACEADEISAHQVWAQTRSDLSFNPYQVIGGTGPGRVDEAFTESMMAECRTVLGSRCVLENNSLRTPPLYAPMYEAMRLAGPPISFQTAVLDKVGDLGATIDYAISAGAASVELPAGYDTLPEPELAAYNARLQANAVLVPNS